VGSFVIGGTGIKKLGVLGFLFIGLYHLSLHK